MKSYLQNKKISIIHPARLIFQMGSPVLSEGPGGTAKAKLPDSMELNLEKVTDTVEKSVRQRAEFASQINLETAIAGQEIAIRNSVVNNLKKQMVEQNKQNLDQKIV